MLGSKPWRLKMPTRTRACILARDPLSEEQPVLFNVFFLEGTNPSKQVRGVPAFAATSLILYRSLLIRSPDRFLGYVGCSSYVGFFFPFSLREHVVSDDDEKQAIRI